MPAPKRIIKNTRSPDKHPGAAQNIRVTGLFVCMQNTALIKNLLALPETNLSSHSALNVA
jgi:hypothetical protein